MKISAASFTKRKITNSLKVQQQRIQIKYGSHTAGYYKRCLKWYLGKGNACVKWYKVNKTG